MIDRRRFIAITERHAAEKHELGRHLQMGFDGPVPNSPRLLRASMNSLFARQQHDGLHEHAEIYPLTNTHLPINGKEQRDWRAEQFVVPSKLLQTRWPIFARDIDCREQVFTALEAPRTIGFGEFRWIHVVLGAFSIGIRWQLGANIGQQFLKGLTG